MRRLRKPSAKGKTGEESTIAAAAGATNLEVLTIAVPNDTSNSGTVAAGSETTHAGVTCSANPNSPTKSYRSVTGNSGVVTVVTPAKLRSRRNIMDTNGSGSSSTIATTTSAACLGKEIFKHFEKSGKSELYGLFNSSCRPNFYFYINLVKKK